MDKKNNLDTHELLTQLFEFYGILLTKIQQQYFNDYYFDDLSLAEIAENAGVSRQAVFDNLKRVENSLRDYEDKLHLAKLYQQLSTIGSDLQTAADQKNINSINQQITKLQETIEEL